MKKRSSVINAPRNADTSSKRRPTKYKLKVCQQRETKFLSNKCQVKKIRGLQQWKLPTMAF